MPRDAREEDFRVSVIMPAYSEKRSLRDNVKKALTYDDVIEVIIIVSAHGDKETLEICKELAETEPKVACRVQGDPSGLGYALREGFDLARGTHLQILYADCEADPGAIRDFIKKARETDADMVVGSRWLAKENVHDYPPVRYIFNQAYQHFFRTLFRTRLHDLTFGFNMLRTDVARNIIWHGKRHEIVTEMVLKAVRFPYRIEEIAVPWKRRSEGKSALKISNYLRYPFMALFILLGPRKYLFHKS